MCDTILRDFSTLGFSFVMDTKWHHIYFHECPITTLGQLQRRSGCNHNQTSQKPCRTTIKLFSQL